MDMHERRVVGESALQRRRFHTAPQFVLGLIKASTRSRWRLVLKELAVTIEND